MMDKLPQPHLVQRLSEKRSASKKYTGIDQDFSLDYMGSTEFETGSAFRAQKGMAEILNSLVIKEIENHSHHKKCWFVGTEAQLQEAQVFFEKAINGRPPGLKESTYIDHTYGTSDWESSLKADGWWAYTEYASPPMQYPWALFISEDLAEKFLIGLSRFRAKLVSEGKISE